MRAALDANVLISAALSPRGTPARLLLGWQAGAFELVVSPQLLAEIRRALAYPKLARLVPPADADADAFAAWLGRAAELAADPPGPPPVQPSSWPSLNPAPTGASQAAAVPPSGSGSLSR